MLLGVGHTTTLFVKLAIGLVQSEFAVFDITLVVLHNHASLHTDGVTLHVIPNPCGITQVTGVHDVIGATVSV